MQPPVTPGETSDEAIVDLLRRRKTAGVAELAVSTGVTATAVRQRLARLIRDGLIVRRAEPAGRGRPSFRYSLSAKGERTAGTNYTDLALTLWKELRAVEDPSVRRGLLQRIAERLADQYRDQVNGETPAERMESYAAIMEARGIPCDFDDSGELPVLTAYACPYPEVADQDRGICAMETMLFEDVFGGDLLLSECRLDGANGCLFRATVAVAQPRR
jgi:predicted ArsR family transcriptional regulator